MYLPPAPPTQTADQYGLTLEDYVYDLKLLSDQRHGQGMLFFILLFSKQRLKPCRVIIATLMLYNFIYHIPQQVSFSICKKSFRISLLS